MISTLHIPKDTLQELKDDVEPRFSHLQEVYVKGFLILTTSYISLMIKMIL